MVLGSSASIDNNFNEQTFDFFPPDSIENNDTTLVIPLPYPFEDDDGSPYYDQTSNPLFLGTPSNITSEIIYDPKTNQYIFTKKIGDFYYRNPTFMTFDEYREFDLSTSISDYWKERSITSGMDSKTGIIPQIHIGGEAFDRIFGGSTIDIRPQGSAELIFGVLANNRDDPTLNVRQRRTVNFDFQEKIQMNVIAKIGDKIEFKTNYNTEATFEFENKLALKYEGKEDEIIKIIEAGDVSMSLPTTLITGCQSLFGIKARLQFGRTTVTSIFSQQESETSTITVQGGAQTNEYSLTAVDYEENRHFFIAQYFRDDVTDSEGKISNRYNEALKNLPIIATNINIIRMEVWVTNIGAAVTENRNIVAFTDIGEYKPYNKEINPIQGHVMPSNYSNDLLIRMDTAKIRNINTVTNYLIGDPFGIGKSGYFVSGGDFEKVESARKLKPSEYNYNSKLGFLSLNTNLNSDQALAVAFQYTKIGDTAVYQVGDFSDQGINAPACLTVKLLKSTTLNTKNPMWDLMMKNVYSLGAYQVNREDFILNIFYSGNKNGVPTAYFTEGDENIKGVPLLHLFNFDNLDQMLNPIKDGDGVFDFIDGAAQNGGTIQSSNGRIYFTVLEPFGKYLRNLFGNDTVLANIYAYDSLYTMTKTGAEQYPDKNKFLIDGFYKSSTSNEISLNALNVPRGSVTVTAGGIPLTENVDYTVDYTLGRVRIINEGILNSGTPVSIKLESTSLFNIQTKRLMGTHIDYAFSKNINFGATIMNLTERPLTQKTNYGDDPISNTIWGFNFGFEKESRFITKMVDKIPLINTKTVSKITVDGEFAHFIPGHSRAIGKSGTSYIDDFEGSKSTIDLRNIGTWFLASTPQHQLDLFPEAVPSEGINYGKNRAKLAWYVIDPLFYDRSGNLKPPNISKGELSKSSVRQILETEVFPNKDIPSGVPTNIAVFNMAYYPEEKGPYNFDAEGVSGLTFGIDQDGNLKVPDSRWGGIMRKIESTDFEEINVEYIEFWMMDPFTEDPHNSGQLYFNLGDISEDILRDSRKSYENGLPTSADVKDVDTTMWGRVPTIQALVESFDNEEDSRPYQDIGYDGLMDEDERTFFKDNPFNNNYLIDIENMYGLNSRAYQNAYQDPSSDNYHYFRGTDYDDNSKYESILERYKMYNGPDGNSPTDKQNPENYPTAATTIPNVEDINRDNTLSEAERYFQYKIDLAPDKMKVGENYITDVYHAQGIPLPNGEIGNVKWYQFKIPVSQPDKVIGNIQDFKSIRFLRMFFKGFEKPIVTRFATFELVRGEWRKYNHSLLAPGEYVPNDIQSQTIFDISAVNIEENGKRYPIPYVVPPGIEREINLGTTSLTRLNEQSMVLKVTDLIDGDARGAYKTTDFDFRQYKKLKMFVHAEKLKENEDPEYGDLTVFIRLGSDFTENYYEYEIPLTFTPWGTSASDPYGIWPEANNFDIDLDELVQVKHNRNIKMRTSGTTVSPSFPYVEYQGANKITVLGVPSISDVKAILIGVRNPKQNSLTSSNDDGDPKSAEIWVNELRLSDFNKKGGWAATARVAANLADLGRIVISGNYSTPGFGSIEKKINETQKETISQFDISTDLELGKFFPENSGVRIPLHFDYSELRSNPEYNPLDPDIKLKEDIKSYNLEDKQDSIKKITQDYVQRKNINFINVRKDRTGSARKARIYDFENFDFTYAYSEIYMRNIDVEFDLQKNYSGGFGYNFTTSPKNIKPFNKSKFLSKSGYFALIKDFNFYYLPKALSFRTDMNRLHNQKKYRNKSKGLIPMKTFYVKTWDWNRNYSLKFDLAQSLSLEYSAMANAYIDEPQGNPEKGTSEYKRNKDTIIDEILSFGTINRFTQALIINYNIPVNKIPLFDWINARASYQSNYSWTASPKSIQNQLGNQIENSNTKLLNGEFNLTKLYNKIPYLKKLDESNKRRRSSVSRPRRNIPEPEPDQQNDTTESKPKVNYFKIIGDQILKILTGFKKGSINYTETSGTFIPGFFPQPSAFGNNWNYTPDTSIFRDPDVFGGSYPKSLAPGIGFVFGDQRDIRNDAFRYGWISPDTLLNQAYATKFTSSLTMRVTFEPLPDFRVEITADRAYSKNHEEYYRADSLGRFNSYSPIDRGSFSMSYISWGTAFVNDNKENISGNFENFLAYRVEIAERLAHENPNWSGNYIEDTITKEYFPEGYGPTSQEVLLPSFLAAYKGSGPGKITLNKFPTIPLPNWRVTYTGLTRINFLQQHFNKISLSHSYRSTYSIGSYSSFIDYREKDGYSSMYYANGTDFIPKYDIGQVTIIEQFSPLLGIDMQWKNSMSTRIEIKKSRNLSLSFINNQLTEVISDELIVGLGYKFKDVSFSIKSIGGGGRKQRLKSDLDIKADFSIRSNKTIIRRIDENNNQVSAGQKIISINTSIDYVINQKFNIRLFFDKIINNPFVSSQYRNSTTNGGISLRFTLNQ